MATARLMETWAHGQDVADALGVPRAPTDRLRHVAHIGVRTRDFAYLVRDRTPPAEPFRVELAGPSGDAVDVGPGGRDAAGHRPGAGLLPARHPAPAPRRPRRSWRDGADADAVARHRAGLRRPARRRAARPGRSSAMTRRRCASPTRPASTATARRPCTRCSPAASIDVLTGDYLAELTMLILGRDRLKDPSLGYAKTFLRQLEPIARHRARPGRQDRHQRRRPQPGRAGRGGPRARRQPRPGRRASRTSRATTCARAPPSSGWASRWPPTPTSARGASPSACAPAPTSSSPAGSPTPRWSSGRPRRTSAGPATTTTRSPARSSPGTSSSAGRRPPAATTRSSRELPALDQPARLPDRRGARRRLVGDHQAPGHRRRGHGRHGHRAAALRDRRRALRRPRRHRPLRHDRAAPTTAPTACGSAACAASRRRRR